MSDEQRFGYRELPGNREMVRVPLGPQEEFRDDMLKAQQAMKQPNVAKPQVGSMTADEAALLRRTVSLPDGSRVEVPALLEEYVRAKDELIEARAAITGLEKELNEERGKVKRLVEELKKHRK